MLELKHLRKTFGELVAVDDLSLTMNPGDVFGFIGPNGAGKTTTIRMLATLLEPTSGTATLNGWDILKDPMEVRAHIGYMPDFFGLYDDVKVWEYLDFFAAAYRLPKRQRPDIISNVLELTDLTVKREAYVQELSRGMQQRLCLAKCLLHDPILLLLDEPASGLDPRARAELKDLIGSLGRMGKIVLVSSHILPELADFCNTVGIIERGRLLACGPVGEIVKSTGKAKTIQVRTLDDPSAVAAWLPGRDGVQAVEAASDHTVRMEFSGDLEAQAGLLQAMVQQGYRVLDFREEEVDLEDVFLTITTGAVQ